jgi:mannose-binding lectin
LLLNSLLLIKKINGGAIMAYVQTSGTHSTNSSSWTQIPGLSLVIPEGVGTTAIIILNVPWPYAGGDNYPGGSFGIEVNGKLSPVIAGFTYNVVNGNARVPTTLVVGIPLGNQPQTITAVWQNVRGSNVTIDTPASLTSIMD